MSLSELASKEKELVTWSIEAMGLRSIPRWGSPAYGVDDYFVLQHHWNPIQNLNQLQLLVNKVCGTELIQWRKLQYALSSFWEEEALYTFILFNQPIKVLYALRKMSQDGL